MNNTAEKLGYQFTPFTFPTHRMLVALNNSYAGQGWTWDNINSMWDWYKDGIKNQNISYWQGGLASPILNYVSEKTGLDKQMVLRWMLVLENEVKDGRFDQIWLTVIASPESIPQKTIETFKETGETIKKAATAPFTLAKSLTGLGVVVIIGVGIWFAWPWMAGLRKKRKGK